MYDGVELSTASSIQRLTASNPTFSSQPKRKPSESSLPRHAFKQPRITSFLTPRTPLSDITNVPTNQMPSSPTRRSRALENHLLPYQNTLIQITDGQDFAACILPDGLKVSGLVIGDGNCLPRAILLAKTGSQNGHERLRERAIAYIRANPDYFSGDIHLMGDSNVDDYCERMSRNGEFGDDVFLMACCMTENVSIQLFTWNCRKSQPTTLSAATFSPSTGSARFIRIHLDTGDTQGQLRIRHPHYDTLISVLRTPLADITNLPNLTRANQQVKSTYNRAASSIKNSNNEMIASTLQEFKPPIIDWQASGPRLIGELTKAEQWLKENPTYDSNIALKNISILRENAKLGGNRLLVESSRIYSPWSMPLVQKSRNGRKTLGFDNRKRGIGVRIVLMIRNWMTLQKESIVKDAKMLY